MASPYRTLRPAPLMDGQEASPRESSNKERNRTLTACQPCREKRRKCSGERPKCRECGRRLLKCVYAARPGQTRLASLQENNERMKTDLDTMMELYWYLQTKPKEELGDAISAIQAGADPSEVIKAIKDRVCSTDVTSTSNSVPEINASSDPCPAIDRDLTSTSSQPSQSVFTASACETQTPTQLSTIETYFSEALTQSKLARIIESLGKGAQAFFTCTGCIFHIYDQNETEKSFDDLQPYLKASGMSWLELVFQGSIPSHLKPALCSLCAMAAVGLQYTKNPIPALGFIPSSSDGSCEFVSVFYESARHLLESVIEINVLEAMRVCAALAIFNTIGHATVAMAYADMGINFVLNIGPSLRTRPSNLSETSWIKHKRVARTLMTLRSWLVSTLGYVHIDHAGLQPSIHWLIDDEGLTPKETIQQELHKIVQIEVNLLRTLDSFKVLSPVLLSSTKRDLDQWHQQLPDWMHLSALLDSTGDAVILRRTIYLVHLFYLSASILLARLAHGVQNSPEAEAIVLLPRYDIEEVRIAAGDGVEAARTAARILQLQMDEQAIFQRCWSCVFSAYMACLTILHSAAQMQLHDLSQSTWQRELSYAKSCLNTLEYCGRVDKVAADFEEVTRGYYDTLVAQGQPMDDTGVLDAPRDFEYLFSVPSTSPDRLVQVSRDLLKRLSCPFDSPPNLHNEGMLRAGLGTHTTLPFQNKPRQDAMPWSAVEMVLSSMPTGQFVGSSQPHGWDVFLNFNTL